MVDEGFASGWSAGWLDVWRRILNLAAIVVPLVLGLVLSLAGMPGPLLGVTMFSLFVALFLTSLLFGIRVTRAMRREMEKGYSTLYDVADFELRNARTLELERAANVVPANPGQRSLLANLLRGKR